MVTFAMAVLAAALLAGSGVAMRLRQAARRFDGPEGPDGDWLREGPPRGRPGDPDPDEGDPEWEIPDGRNQDAGPSGGGFPDKGFPGSGRRVGAAGAAGTE